MPEWITLPYGISYEEVIRLMENRVVEVYSKAAQEAIYLVEHQKIYTAGTNFQPEDLIDPGDIPVIYTGRGGRFTYHGPGQRVIYPVLDLGQRQKKDIKLYINMLQKWIINSLAAIDVHAFSLKDQVGVWVNDAGTIAKIASIGIRIKKWVTYYGVAVNIYTDLEAFSGIIACGNTNFAITSLLKLGVRMDFIAFDQVLKTEFDNIFK